MAKPVTQKLSKETKCAVRRAFRSVNDDMCQNKARWCTMFFLAGFVGVMLSQSVGFIWYTLAVMEFVLLASILNMVVTAAKKPGRLVHEWALEENEKITIGGLQGKTTEELEKLLQYHMDKGNMEAADRISQKMLNMVDGMPDHDPIPLVTPAVQQISQKAIDPGVVLKVPAASGKSNLPDWMQDGKNKTAAEEEPQQQSKLPDWMNQ